MDNFREPTEHRQGYDSCPYSTRGCMHNRNLKNHLLLVLLFSLFFLPKVSALPMKEKPEPTHQMRIVSLSPNVTETLYALGAGSTLVGRTDYCNYPAQALEIPSVGTLYNPSLEKLLALEPNLVISSAFVPDELLASIESAGIEVLSIDTQQTFHGTYDLIRQIAAKVEKKAEAELIILDIQNKVKQVDDTIRLLPKPNAYIVIDFGSFDGTATGDTYLSEMLGMAGANNIAQDATNWTYSKELLVEAEPELILISPRWGETAEQTIHAFRTTKPYSDLSGEIRTIDADLISRQGPRSGEALLDLARTIHPEAWK